MTPPIFGTLLLTLALTIGPLGLPAAELLGEQVIADDSSAVSPPPEEFIVEASPQAAVAAGLTVVGEAGFGWTLVTEPVTVDVSTDEVAAEIATTTGLDVEPNHEYQLVDEPLFPEQWSLENNGQTGGKGGADIDILSAWETSTGDPDVVVAVLDTGVRFTHPDLSSNIWVNSDEVAGNGLDDDGNGWVDDVRGWDAVGDDANPNDTHGHGTFVSTTAVGAVNGVGMAGVAPDSVVMPIRVCGGGGCPFDAILTGLEYAIANDADVINLSLGGEHKSEAMESAIQDAVDAGITVVAAAGNNGSNNDVRPFYPASYVIDGLISVAASSHTDSLASFSNYGATSVDLAAPGQNVVGGVLPKGWGHGSGTSFSAPHVAGVAALVKSVRPDLSPVQVAEILIASVDVSAGLSGKVASGGRLDAGSALYHATAPVAVATMSSSGGILPFTVQLSGAQSYVPVGEIVTWSWKLPNGSIVAASETAWSPTTPGTYTATLTVVGNEGLTDSATVSFTAAVPASGTFVDDDQHFAQGAIEAIAAIGVTQGCNPPDNDRFCPQGVVTRGQMAAFLARALNLSSGPNAFDDDQGSVYEQSINKLSAAGITLGCNPPANTRFCPDDVVTRGQMAAFLARAFELTAPAASDVFDDDDSSVFEAAIDRLSAAGITSGCNPPSNDRYCPESDVKRGEMAVFLARALGLTPIAPPAS